jgi:hypothetical protein
MGFGGHCKAAIRSRECPRWVKSSVPSEKRHVSFDRQRTFSPRWLQYRRQLARRIGLPLSSYLADILGFDPGQALKRLRAVRR